MTLFALELSLQKGNRAKDILAIAFFDCKTKLSYAHYKLKPLVNHPDYKLTSLGSINAVVLDEHLNPTPQQIAEQFDRTGYIWHNNVYPSTGFIVEG